jgi:tetratricopeptide (TPR) repeat protein
MGTIFQRPLVGLALLLAAAFALACRIGASGSMAAAARGDDAVDDLLGGSRAFLGDLAMSRAELYLHRGLSGAGVTAFTNSWFQRLDDAVCPKALEHREGAAGLRDVLPWVAMADRAAPTNTAYALTHAYLLRVTGDAPRALAEIRRLRAIAPASPEAPLEEARIRVALGQWERAAAALETCVRLVGPRPAEAQSPVLADALVLRALLFERAAATHSAAGCLAQAIRLEPQMWGGLSNRLAALQSGQPPAVPVAQLLAQYQRMQGNPICAHDHEDPGGHDHHDKDDGD